jgi:hypothetical protein
VTKPIAILMGGPKDGQRVMVTGIRAVFMTLENDGYRSHTYEWRKVGNEFIGVYQGATRKADR